MFNVQTQSVLIFDLHYPQKLMNITPTYCFCFKRKSLLTLYIKSKYFSRKNFQVRPETPSCHLCGIYEKTKTVLGGRGKFTTVWSMSCQGRLSQGRKQLIQEKIPSPGSVDRQSLFPYCKLFYGNDLSVLQ